MKFFKLTTLAAVCAGTVCLTLPRASAQDDGPPPPPPPEAPAAPAAAAPPPGGAEGADRREQFRQRLNERTKAQLQANDQEWAVIQPLLVKVQDKLQQTMTDRFAGMRPPRGGGGPGGGPGGEDGGPRPERAERQPRPDRPQPAGSAESQALRTALESPATSNTEIKAKLEALRESRKKAAADLEQARADLKAVLTLRQEAVLVNMGMLD